MRRSFIDPATLKAVAELISDMADTAVRVPVGHGCGCRDFDDDFDDEPFLLEPDFAPVHFGRQPIGVAGFPREDRNKVFGLNVRVDEPTPDMFWNRWEFEKAREKFDRLVDAAEACDWDNKSNTATLHRVNAIRRPAHMLPPTGINLVGESRMWR